MKEEKWRKSIHGSGSHTGDNSAEDMTDRKIKGTEVRVMAKRRGHRFGCGTQRVVLRSNLRLQ